MKRTTVTKFTTLCLVLAPAVPACSITDIAGTLDAGVGGAESYGGSSALAASAGGMFTSSGGATEASATGGMAMSGTATGGAVALGTAAGGSASGGTKATGTQSSTGGSDGTIVPTWVTPDGCVAGDENPTFVGTWDGYVQGSPIGDEASSLRLNILGANSSGLCGTVTFGTSTEPVTLPPATDPTAWYPESLVQQVKSGVIGPVLGLTYTIQNGQVAGQRTTFDVFYTEIFNSWCALQTPYPRDSTGSSYACLPPYTGASVSETRCSLSLVGGGQQEFSCAQVYLCGKERYCSCSAEACTAATEGNLFDLLFNGNQAIGTFGADTVVFNRIAPAQQ